MGGAARAEELEGTRSEAMVPATPLPTSRLRTPTARLERSDREATIYGHQGQAAQHGRVGAG